MVDFVKPAPHLRVRTENNQPVSEKDEPTDGIADPRMKKRGLCGAGAVRVRLWGRSQALGSIVPGGDSFEPGLNVCDNEALQSVDMGPLLSSPSDN